MKVGSRKFALDSSLEGNGFELPVPHEIGSGFEASAELGRSTVGAAVSSAQSSAAANR
jgi:hypothetical protein